MSDKAANIDFVLRQLFIRLAIDLPSNYDDLLDFVIEDVNETADDKDWNDSDVAIAFRRFIELERIAPVEKMTLQEQYEASKTDTAFIEWVAEKFNMDSTGTCYKQDRNFRDKNSKPCYISEHGEDEGDVFSYQDLEKEVKEWLADTHTQEYLLGNKLEGLFTIETWVDNLYNSLEWQHPSTVLQDYTL